MHYRAWGKCPLLPHRVRWIEADPFGDCSCSWHGAVSVYPEAGLPGWWLSGTRAGFERAWYKLIRLHPVGQGQHVVALLVSDRSPRLSGNACHLLRRQAVSVRFDDVMHLLCLLTQAIIPVRRTVQGA